MSVNTGAFYNSNNKIVSIRIIKSFRNTMPYLIMHPLILLFIFYYFSAFIYISTRSMFMNTPISIKEKLKVSLSFPIIAPFLLIILVLKRDLIIDYVEKALKHDRMVEKDSMA